jgi:hypothetical protein
MTLKAVTFGIFLAFVFGSANAYLGMRAGQTVAATIPAAIGFDFVGSDHLRAGDVGDSCHGYAGGRGSVGSGCGGVRGLLDIGIVDSRI